MDNSITISVTQEDIDVGKVKDCRACPIAVAVDRMIYPYKAQVTSNYVQVFSPCGRYWKTLTMPDAAIAFVSEYDEQQPVRPFMFKMEVTYPSASDDGFHSQSDLEQKDAYHYLDKLVYA